MNSWVGLQICHHVAICFQLKIPNFSIYAGDYSCTAEVHRAIPILKKAYGDSMHKVLHVGPDTCSVVSKLLKEEETYAWGVEPYDIEDADSNCRALVHKGIVRVADIKFSLPYRPKSFSLVIVSDALDYLSPRYLNRTLPDLARVSADGIVIFTGNYLKRAYPLFKMEVAYICTFWSNIESFILGIDQVSNTLDLMLLVSVLCYYFSNLCPIEDLYRLFADLDQLLYKGMPKPCKANSTYILVESPISKVHELDLEFFYYVYISKNSQLKCISPPSS